MKDTIIGISIWLIAIVSSIFIYRQNKKIEKQTDNKESQNLKPEDKKEQEENHPYLDCGCSCGCAIILLIIGIKLVVWAWHIHWFFGLLVLLICLSFFVE